jgi:predicted AAA+ superfamily ATPase
MAGTLSVKPDTIKSDVSALKQVLWGWELPVAALSRARQIRKEKKFYPVDLCFADYARPIMEGARFEAAVACLLRRALCGFHEGYDPQVLFGFYRDYNRREVDFVVFYGKDVHLAVECKTNMKADASNLVSFTRQFKPKEALLVVDDEGVFERVDEHYIVSVELLASIL